MSKFMDRYGDKVVGQLITIAGAAVIALGGIMATNWNDAVAYSGHSAQEAFWTTVIIIVDIALGLCILFLVGKDLFSADQKATKETFFAFVFGAALLIFGIYYFIDMYSYEPPPIKQPSRFPGLPTIHTTFRKPS